MMWAYGAYGATEDPLFVGSWVSYMDRGIAVVDAHVRGGSEMGRDWYDQGRLGNKKNTFHDVIAIAEELGRLGFTPNNNLVLQGGSAGGLLVGATLNMAPHLFSGAVAQVPFVDVLTTMSNPDLPLTKYEYQEWGNPTDDVEARALIASYSPIDNVTAQAYPPILATTGFNDPRVGYWEPAKWVLTLRDQSTSDAPTYLRTNMGAGHGGDTGRSESFEEASVVMAFILQCLGVAHETRLELAA
jgi:oligopeptidase B